MSLNPYEQQLRVSAGPEPSRDQLEPLVLDQLKARLKDPDSVKQFRLVGVMKTRWFLGPAISNPGAAEGWLVCFEYNAKNSYGGYTGTHIDGFVFQTAPSSPPSFVMTQSMAIMSPRCPA